MAWTALRLIVFAIICVLITESQTTCQSYNCINPNLLSKGTGAPCASESCTLVECCGCKPALCSERVCEPTETGFICHNPVPSCEPKDTWDFGYEPGSPVIGYQFNPDSGACVNVTGDSTYTLGRQALYADQMTCTQSCIKCATTTCLDGICQDTESGYQCFDLPKNVSDAKICADVTTLTLGSGSTSLGYGMNGTECVEVWGEEAFQGAFPNSISDCRKMCLHGTNFATSNLSSQTYTWIVLATILLCVALFSYFKENGWLVICGIQGPVPYTKGFLQQLARQVNKEYKSTQRMETDDIETRSRQESVPALESP